MSARRPAAIRAARSPLPNRDATWPTTVWAQPLTYVLVIASLVAAVVIKDLFLALVAALH